MIIIEIGVIQVLKEALRIWMNTWIIRIVGASGRGEDIWGITGTTGLSGPKDGRKASLERITR